MPKDNVDPEKTMDAVWCRNSEDGYDYLMDRSSNRVIAKRKNRSEYHKAWWAKNAEKRHQYWLRRSYDISVERYNELLAVQSGVCAICFQPDKFREKLSVDHDHKTGKIRGLLCHKCNAVLGLANDRLDTLKNAVRYLEKNYAY